MIYLILLLLCVEVVVNSTQIHWQPTTSFTDVRNWHANLTNHSLGACSRAVINNDFEGAILVEANVILEELILPLNGLLAFDEGTSITFDDGFRDKLNENRDCEDEEIFFEGSYSQDLFDPANYCSYSEDAFEDVSGTRSESSSDRELDGGDSLHQPTRPQQMDCPRSDRTEVDQLPTIEDDLVFPTKGHFTVSMTSLNAVLPLHSLQVNGKVYNTSAEFTSYLAGANGRMQFINSNYANATKILIGIPDHSCSKLGNCHHPEFVRRHVCSKVKCPVLQCDISLTTQRTCCPLCGAAALTVYTNSAVGQVLNLNLLRSILEEEKTNQANGKKVVTIKVAYVDDSTTEIVFQALDSDDKSVYYIAENFRQRLQGGEIDKMKHYKDLQVYIKRSFQIRSREMPTEIYVSWFSKLSYISAGLILFAVLCSIYIVRNTSTVLIGLSKIPLISKLLKSNTYSLNNCNSETEMSSTNFENVMYNSNCCIEESSINNEMRLK